MMAPTEWEPSGSFGNGKTPESSQSRQRYPTVTGACSHPPAEPGIARIWSIRSRLTDYAEAAVSVCRGHARQPRPDHEDVRSADGDDPGGGDVSIFGKFERKVESAVNGVFARA